VAKLKNERSREYNPRRPPGHPKPDVKRPPGGGLLGTKYVLPRRQAMVARSVLKVALGRIAFEVFSKSGA
jgi:hypothetical protein